MNEQDGTTDMCRWFSYQQCLDLPLVELAQLGLDLAFEAEALRYRQ